MKQIIINSPKHGKHIALIDDGDYQMVVAYKWYLRKTKGTFYAQCWSKMVAGKRHGIHMHRIILGVTDPKVFVDHKDHNGLNNLRSNIRICTQSQNAKNRTSEKNVTSVYLGVSLNIDKRNKKEYKYWAVHFKINGKLKHVGQFPNTKEGEVKAAKRYDHYALNNYGEFANLNFPA